MRRSPRTCTCTPCRSVYIPQPLHHPTRYLARLELVHHVGGVPQPLQHAAYFSLGLVLILGSRDSLNETHPMIPIPHVQLGGAQQRRRVVRRGQEGQHAGVRQSKRGGHGRLGWDALHLPRLFYGWQLPGFLATHSGRFQTKGEKRNSPPILYPFGYRR